MDDTPKINVNKVEQVESMGFPKEWANLRYVFLRKFRWLLEPTQNPEVSKWFEKVKINYLAKQIEFEVIDDAEGVVFNWLADMVADNALQQFEMKLLDGCGVVVAKLHFSRLKLLEHTQEYDYSKSYLLKHKVKIEYKFVRRTSNLQVN